MAKFEKGESGNPGGRPAGVGRIREIAQQHTDQAIETLVRVMNSETASHSAQVAAASALLDRGYGRPEQSVKASLEQLDIGAALKEMSERLQREKETENTSTLEPVIIPALLAS